MKRGDMPASPHTEYDADGNLPKGMTIRERMAMAAMQGFCAAPEFAQSSVEDLADTAVLQADALLAELERTGGGEDE